MSDSPLDVLVLGSGVAGLTAAVRAAEVHGLRVGVLTKGELQQATTRWAQGGVAAVLGGADPDSADQHLADTLAAGAGLCDADAVRVLVDEGPDRVTELIALGATFDLDAHGEYSLTREGGHSHAASPSRRRCSHRGRDRAHARRRRPGDDRGGARAHLRPRSARVWWSLPWGARAGDLTGQPSRCRPATCCSPLGDSVSSSP